MIAVLFVCIGLFFLGDAAMTPSVYFIQQLVIQSVIGGLLIGFFTKDAWRYVKETIEKQ